MKAKISPNSNKSKPLTKPVSILQKACRYFQILNINPKEEVSLATITNDLSVTCVSLYKRTAVRSDFLFVLQISNKAKVTR